MARAKKAVARPRRSASGFDNDSSTATSPSVEFVESVPLLEDQFESGAASAARITENAEASSQQAPLSQQPETSSQQTPVSENTPSAITSVKRSWVWEHFKEYDKKEKVKDAQEKIVEMVVKRAHCLYCPRGII
ncbi:hypothetical protein M0R45_016122 [Rubus argutus]|uniref:Uncharacterized protein n=1 Tax=Rubus argutus TaxID=59490 RepID=A0AAW1XSR2_RUBAR